MKVVFAPISRLLQRIWSNVWVLLLITMLMWGGNILMARLSAGEVSVMTVLALRWNAVVLLLALIRGRKLAADLHDLRPYWGYVLAMGVIGYTVSNFMLYFGAIYTTAVNTSIIQGLSPAFVFLGGWAAFGLRPRSAQIFGAMLTLVGVALIAVQGDFANAGALRFNTGDLIQILGVLTYGTFTLALRRRPRMPAMTFFVGLALAAALTTLPLMGAEWALGYGKWPTLKGWAVILYASTLTSIAGQIFFIRAVEQIGPGRAGLFQNLVPIVGAMLAITLLGEPFHLYHAAALVLVLGGIFIAERANLRR